MAVFQDEWEFKQFIEYKDPTEEDLQLTALLDDWIKENAEIEDEKEKKHKLIIMGEIRATVLTWVSSHEWIHYSDYLYMDVGETDLSC